MTTLYQPSSRRHIAGIFRLSAQGAVTACVRLGIHPDVVSYASVAAAGAAAICFWRAGGHESLLAVGPLFCVIRLWLNMLDGMVALAAGKASLRGEILNDLPDRLSDVLIFVGVAHSGLCAVASGYWAAILAVMTAYVGLTGQAVGGRREYGGIMSKPWRMVVLSVGALLTAGLEVYALPTTWGPLTVLDWTCLVIAAGCVQTIVLRLRRVFAALEKRAEVGEGEK